MNIERTIRPGSVEFWESLVGALSALERRAKDPDWWWFMNVREADDWTDFGGEA